MNQILSVEMSKSKKNGHNKKASIKTIVIFFCIIILLFGIAILAMGVISRLNSDDNSDDSLLANTNTNTNTDIFAEVIKPNIEIIQNNTKLNVTVTSDIEIDNVVYKWNDEEETQVNGNGETTLEMEINVPTGTNTFNIVATDVDGGVQTFEKQYTAIEQYEPTISLEQEDNTIKITCTSEETISYISYIYDDETEMTQQVDDVTGEISIDITEGEHTLSIVVVNTDGEEYEETKQLYIPTASIVTDGTDFIVNVSDSRGISTVNITFNGEEQEEIEVNDTTYETTLKLEDGENKIILVVTNSDGLSITKRVRYEK